jgi:hypothetical protein
MSEEAMQRTMEFMLEQQAQFAADIQILREAQTANQERLKKAEDRIEQLEGTLAKTIHILEKMTNLQEQAVANVSALPPIIAETDERVNTLITIFERFLSEGLKKQMEKAEAGEAAGEEKKDDKESGAE